MNSDGIAHATVSNLDEGGTLVGFEDLLGGGDKDYNDLVFSFSNTNTEAKLKTIADEIIHVVNQPLVIDGQHCFIGISIGCAVSDGVSVLANELLTLADDAMYTAKRSGKNRFKVAKKHTSRIRSISV